MNSEVQNMLAGLEIPELQEAQKHITDLIAQKQEAEKLKIEETFKEMAEKSGLSLDNIIWREESTKGRKRGPKGGKRPAAPLYRNPDDSSQTWSGVGRKPKWFLEKTESGYTLEQLKIAA